MPLGKFGEIIETGTNLVGRVGGFLGSLGSLFPTGTGPTGGLTPTPPSTGPTPPPGYTGPPVAVGGTPPVALPFPTGGIYSGIGTALSNFLSNINPFTPPAVHGPEPFNTPTGIIPGGPGQTAISPSAALQANPILTAAIGGMGRGRDKRALFQLLLASGALNGIVADPIVYQGPNGMVKYGSYPGNVIIRYRNGNQPGVVQMPKFIARQLGFWKPRKKPIISVRDSNAIRRSNSARKRLHKAAKDSGLYVRANKPARTTTRRRRR